MPLLHRGGRELGAHLMRERAKVHRDERRRIAGIRLRMSQAQHLMSRVSGTAKRRLRSGERLRAARIGCAHALQMKQRCRERGAQVVGGRRKHFALGVDDALQAREHVVQRVDQRMHFERRAG